MTHRETAAVMTYISSAKVEKDNLEYEETHEFAEEHETGLNKRMIEAEEGRKRIKGNAK